MKFCAASAGSVWSQSTPPLVDLKMPLTDRSRVCEEHVRVGRVDEHRPLAAVVEGNAVAAGVDVHPRRPAVGGLVNALPARPEVHDGRVARIDDERVRAEVSPGPRGRVDVEAHAGRRDVLPGAGVARARTEGGACGDHVGRAGPDIHGTRSVRARRVDDPRRVGRVARIGAGARVRAGAGRGVRGARERGDREGRRPDRLPGWGRHESASCKP